MRRTLAVVLSMTFVPACRQLSTYETKPSEPPKSAELQKDYNQASLELEQLRLTASQSIEQKPVYVQWKDCYHRFIPEQVFNYCGLPPEKEAKRQLEEDRDRLPLEVVRLDRLAVELNKAIAKERDTKK
jgi:hypothetical protein